MVCSYKKTSTGSPVFTTEEMKVYLKIDDFSVEDALITSLVSAATEFAEAYCWRSFTASAYELYTDSWETATRLPINPVDAITSVEYYDANNDKQTLPDTAYIESLGLVPGELTFLEEKPLHARRNDKIIINFSTNPVVPEPVKQAIRLQVGMWYENREDAPVALNMASKRAMHPFRYWQHYTWKLPDP